MQLRPGVRRDHALFGIDRFIANTDDPEKIDFTTMSSRTKWRTNGGRTR